MANLWTIVSFCVSINLLLLSFCCSSPASISANYNVDDATFIEDEDVASFRGARESYVTPSLDQFQCGRGPAELPRREMVENKIVGGREAVKNSWPFMVALRYNNVLRCGGSLISPNKILTAAHCVERESLFGISQITVSLGMHIVAKNDAQVTRRVTRVKIHNGYAFLTKTNVSTILVLSKSNKDLSSFQYGPITRNLPIDLYSILQVNDIAILTLDDPVPYSSAISPVCLPPANANPDQYAGRDAAAMGWGRLQEGGIESDVLRETTLRITTYAECKVAYPKLLTSMLCNFSPGKDTCQGDSGSPIVIQSAAGVWTQVGIVSFGLGCARPGFPGVNTRVTAFSDWIEKYST